MRRRQRESSLDFWLGVLLFAFFACVVVVVGLALLYCAWKTGVFVYELASLMRTAP